jgi:hypothetical protein
MAVLMAAPWPRARRWIGWGSPALAGLSVVLVVLTTGFGEQLEHRVEETALVQRHAALGDQVLPWVVAILAVAVLVWVRGRSTSSPAVSDQPRGDVRLTRGGTSPQAGRGGGRATVAPPGQVISRSGWMI